MKSFRESESFIKAVESGNVFKIKSNLEGLISLLDGDKKKCMEAINYAIEKSNFKWEDDDGIFFGESFKTDKEKYLYEKERLVQNFTKERFEQVIELYNKINISKSSNFKSETQNITTKDKEWNGRKRKTETDSNKSKKRVASCRVRQENSKLPLILLGVAGAIAIGIIFKVVLK